MASRSIITDDITGRESADTAGHKVTWGGKVYALDLTDESAAALKALFAGRDVTALTALLAPAAPAPATRSTRARSASATGTGDHAAARAWARDTPAGHAWVKAQPDGFKLGEKGRAPAALREAHAAALASGGKPITGSAPAA